MWFWVEMPKRIGITRVDKVLHPFTLCWQETRTIGIGFRIMDINGTVTDIKIATDYQFWLLFQKVIAVQLKIIQEFVLEILPYISSCSRREIYAHHRGFIKVGTDNSTFKIIIFMATTIFNMIRGNPSEYCSTAIAFFLGRVPIVFIAHLL